MGARQVVGSGAAAVMGQRALEQRGRVAAVGEQRAPVVDGGERPGPLRPVREWTELLNPDSRLLAVIGSNGGLDPVDSSESAEGAHPDVPEVVQGCLVVPLVTRAGSQRPPGEVVDRIGEDPQWA